jgi:hypothetical protein
MFAFSLLISFGLVASTIAQNQVSTYSTETVPLGTGTIISLAPMEVYCKPFGGLLKKFQLIRPSEPTLKYSYDCIQAPTSPYLLSTSNQETILNNCHGGSINYLSGHDVNCQGGLISNFQLKYVPAGPSIQYLYSCSNYGTLSCYIGVTVEQLANNANDNVVFLDRFKDLECNAGYALSSFVYSSFYSDWSRYWHGKYTFTCCRISAMTTVPSINPTATPTTKTPSVFPTNAPVTMNPSALPTTSGPSPGPTSTPPSAHPTTDRPSIQPVTSIPTYPATPPPTPEPTTSHPTDTQTPTSQPTVIDPITQLFKTVTVVGVFAICCFFIFAIIMLCFYCVWKQHKTSSQARQLQKSQRDDVEACKASAPQETPQYEIVPIADQLPEHIKT